MFHAFIHVCLCYCVCNWTCLHPSDQLGRPSSMFTSWQQPLPTQCAMLLRTIAERTALSHAVDHSHHCDLRLALTQHLTFMICRMAAKSACDVVADETSSDGNADPLRKIAAEQGAAMRANVRINIIAAICKIAVCAGNHTNNTAQWTLTGRSCISHCAMYRIAQSRLFTRTSIAKCAPSSLCELQSTYCLPWCSGCHRCAVRTPVFVLCNQRINPVQISLASHWRCTCRKKCITGCRLHMLELWSVSAASGATTLRN